MSARRRLIDPMTGDYAQDASGRLAEDVTVASSCVLALRTPFGSAGAIPDFGSRHREIKKATANAKGLAKAYAAQALVHLVEQKAVTALTTDAEVDGDALGVSASFKQQVGVRRPISVKVGS